MGTSSKDSTTVKQSTSAPVTLVIDVGGTHIKVLAEDKRQVVKIVSGANMTPEVMARDVLKATAGWKYDRITIGYPGPVHHDKPILEPHNLGSGWINFPFKTTFNKPLKMINDAAMQAYGSYRGGRMLFLGVGTGLGSALVIADTVQPMELAHLPYRKGMTYEDYVGLRGLERMGKKKWRKHVLHVIDILSKGLGSEYVVLGGGNAKLLKDLPNGVELGANDNAFLGGFKLWHKSS